MIFITYIYIDEYNNVIEEIREAEEFSFFKKIKILISTIMFSITSNKNMTTISKKLARILETLYES